MDVQSACQELEVSQDATSDVIKAKYRSLVLALHPDRNDGRNEARLKRITAAYHTLKGADLHRSSVGEQRTAQNARNTQRTTAHKTRRKMQGTRTPEEDWSRFTSEFEQDEAFWREYERNFWQDYEKRRSAQSMSAEEINQEYAESQRRARKNQKRNTDHGSGFSKARTQAVPRYNIQIDKSLCIGCCSCETIAPKTFYIDKNVHVNPKSSVIDPVGSGVETMMDAAKTCPTKAIIVDDALTRLRMYPL